MLEISKNTIKIQIFKKNSKATDYSFIGTKEKIACSYEGLPQ